MNRFIDALAVAALVIGLSSFAACGSNGPPPPDINADRVFEPNADVDTSTAPGEDTDVDRRTVSASLRSNQVRTRHVFDGAVTAGKVAYKAVTVTVAMGASSGASMADADLVNGILIGCHPSTNQDQFVDNIALTAGTGVITVTLADNATAANVFRCIALKANAKGIT